jgi:hypothetical protein
VAGVAAALKNVAKARHNFPPQFINTLLFHSTDENRSVNTSC